MSGLDPETAHRLAELFAALGDPTRVRLIALLLDGEAHVSALAQAVCPLNRRSPINCAPCVNCAWCAPAARAAAFTMRWTMTTSRLCSAPAWTTSSTDNLGPRASP